MDELLERIAMPRPGGSEGLREIGLYIEATLRTHGAEVELQTFTGTPLGFALLWATLLLLVVTFGVASLRGRHGLALLRVSAVPVLVLLKMEWLQSVVSFLDSEEEASIVGTFPGTLDGPLLVLAAHYDTATSFGDHVSWAQWTAPAGLARVREVTRQLESRFDKISIPRLFT